MYLIEPECRFSSGSQYQLKTAHFCGPFLIGTESRNRTGTPLQARDFESRASTSSAIPAYEFVLHRVQQHEVVAPFETS